MSNMELARSKGQRRRNGVPSAALCLLFVIPWDCFLVLNWRIHLGMHHHLPVCFQRNCIIWAVGTWIMQSCRFMTTVSFGFFAYTLRVEFQFWWHNHLVLARRHVSQYTLQISSWTGVKCQIPKLFHSCAIRCMCKPDLIQTKQDCWGSSGIQFSLLYVCVPFPVVEKKYTSPWNEFQPSREATSFTTI